MHFHPPGPLNRPAPLSNGIRSHGNAPSLHDHALTMGLAFQDSIHIRFGAKKRTSQAQTLWEGLPPELSESLRSGIAEKLAASSEALENPGGLKTRVDRLLKRLKQEPEALEEVGQLLERFGDIGFAELACRLTGQLERFPNENVCTPAEYPRQILKLIDNMTAASKTEPLSLPVVKTIFRDCAAFLEAIEDTSEFPNEFTFALCRTLMLLDDKSIPPSQFRRYLPVIHDLVTLEQHKITSRILNVLREQEQAPEKYHLIAQAIKAYQATVTPPDNLNPVIYCIEHVLKREKPERWPLYLEGFGEAMSALPLEEREDLLSEESSISPLVQKVADRCFEGKFQGGFSSLLKAVFQARHTLRPLFPKVDINLPLMQLVQDSPSLIEFNTKVETLKSVMTATSGTGEQHQALERFLQMMLSPNQLSKVTALAHQVSENPDVLQRFILFFTHPGLSDLPADSLNWMIAQVMSGEKNTAGQSFFQEYPDVVDMLKPIYQAHAGREEYYKTLLDMVIRLPGKWSDTAKILQFLDFVPEDLGIFQQDAKSQMQRFKDNMQLLTLMRFPTRFLNYCMLNQKKIDLTTMWGAFYLIEHHPEKDFGLDLLPELLALLGPFARKAKEAQPDKRYQMKTTANEASMDATGVIEQASMAITRLYNFIANSAEAKAVNQIQGVTYNNWSRIGTLGLSFTKWQFDAMRRWKGFGPSEKISLMEQSGLFAPIPKRPNDSAYFGGFLHHNPETDLSIEMRRAYIVISKPGSGTLVIRNSSPDFGRHLLEEPAYFHPDREYTDSGNLFDPDTDLEAHGFQSVLERKLNQEEVQFENQKQIETLLNEFDGMMRQYTDWKCGFKDGKAPSGFRELLNASLASAMQGGATTPFGKHKNIRLAWVTPSELPLPVRSFDVNDPVNLAEISFCVKVLSKQLTVKEFSEYSRQMPRLIEFLSEGLKGGLELVLTE